jgi:hypothetical protein
MKARTTPSTQEGQARAANRERRDDQIAAFYSDHADRLMRVARRRVDRVAEEVIEDARHTACTQLLRRHDVTLNACGSTG